MICPECGEQMWNYGPGQMRCSKDHVFATVSIKELPERIVRVDSLSRRERLIDYTLCYGVGAISTAIVAVLVERL
jgi:hypothetical protein